MAVLLYDRHLTTVRLIFANRLSEESFAQLEVLFGTDNAAGFIVIRKSMVTPVSCGFTKRSRAPPTDTDSLALPLIVSLLMTFLF